MISIREIAAVETYPVRHEVLRAGKPIETCAFVADDEPTTHHFGLYEDEKLISVATIVEDHSDYFDDEVQYRLRGMAVLKEYQGKGFGEKLLSYCEEYLRKKGKAMFWFNARIIAVPFYEKSGYRTIGGLFEIGDIGDHYVMYKKID